MTQLISSADGTSSRAAVQLAGLILAVGSLPGGRSTLAGQVPP